MMNVCGYCVDCTVYAISVYFSASRKRKKRQHSPVDYSDSPTPHCSHGASDAAVEDASVALGGEGEGLLLPC